MDLLVQISGVVGLDERRGLLGGIHGKGVDIENGVVRVRTDALVLGEGVKGSRSQKIPIIAASQPRILADLLLLHS